MVPALCLCLMLRLDAAGVPLPPGVLQTYVGNVGLLPPGDYRPAQFRPAGRNVLVFGKSAALLDPVRGVVLDADPGRGRPVLAPTAAGVLTADADGTVPLGRGGSFNVMPGTDRYAVGPDGRVAVVVLDEVRRNSIDETRHLIFTIDPKTGAKTPIPVPDAGPILGLAFHDGGKVLTVAHGAVTVSRFAADTGTLLDERGHTGVARSFAVGFAADGRTAAGIGYTGRFGGVGKLFRFDPGTKAAVPLGDCQGGDAAPHFTPDGARLWVFDGTRWRGFRTAGGEFARTDETGPGCLTADGARILACPTSGSFAVYDAATGARLIGPDLPDPVTGLAVRADGKLVAITGFRTMVFDAATAAKEAEYAAAGRVPDCVSADGERVAEMFGEAAPGSVILNTRTGGRTPLSAPPEPAYVFKFPAGPGVFGRGNDVLFHWPTPAAAPTKLPFKAEFLALRGDGTWAVCRAGENPLWAIDGAKIARHSLPPGLDRVEAAAFLPDGRLVAAGGAAKVDGGRLMLLDPGNTREVWLSALDPAELPKCVAVDPGGYAAAVGFERRETLVVELATGRVRAVLPTPAYALTFGPLGRSLIVAHRDTPLRAWDLWGDLARPPNLTPAAIKELLAHPDPAAALPALRALARGGDGTLKALAALLPPRTPLTDPEIAKLIENLDAPAFATRDAALKKLREHAAACFPALKTALERSKSAEVRQKAEALLKADVRIPAGDALRRRRAAEAAAWAGTPLGRDLAAAWSR